MLSKITLNLSKNSFALSHSPKTLLPIQMRRISLHMNS